MGVLDKIVVYIQLAISCSPLVKEKKNGEKIYITSAALFCDGGACEGVHSLV